MSTTPLLIAEKISIPHRLKDISFTLETGEILGVLGENGSGKSSLFAALAGLIPFSGKVWLNGQNIQTLPAQTRAQLLAMVFQENVCAWNLSVREIVALGRLPWKDQNQQAIDSALNINGLSLLQQRKITTLSGGEKARVMLARALATQPKLLLADEPFANLDPFYQRALFHTLQAFVKQGASLMISLHHIQLAKHLCQRILLLKHGQLLAIGTPQNVFTDANLQKAFRLNAADMFL